MAVQKAWKVYGVAGHRQRNSFQPSASYNWSRDGVTRILTVINSDLTNTNDYTIVIITRDTAKDCDREFSGQLSDGLFENSRFGKIEELY